jgi:hypothetical protein
MGSTCIEGSAPEGAPEARITWKDAELNVKRNTMVGLNPDGSWGVCAGVNFVEAGDRIRVRVGSMSHLLVIP